MRERFTEVITAPIEQVTDSSVSGPPIEAEADFLDPVKAETVGRAALLYVTTHNPDSMAVLDEYTKSINDPEHRFTKHPDEAFNSDQSNKVWDALVELEKQAEFYEKLYNIDPAHFAQLSIKQFMEVGE